jgi:mono/diheme cytochrome c family protein
LGKNKQRHRTKTRATALKEIAMSDNVHSGNMLPMTILCFLTGGVAAVTLSSRQAEARPEYAQQTGLSCGRCHVNPAGGGANTAFGKAFAANGHKLPGKKK